MHTDEIFGSFKINSILNIKTKINRKKKENRFKIQTRQWFECWLDKTANVYEAMMKFLSDDADAVVSYLDADFILIQFMLILMQICVLH